MRATASRSSPEARIPRHILDSSHLWPVVLWANGRRMMMVPVEFTTENVHGEVEATRGQVIDFSTAKSSHRSDLDAFSRYHLS